MKLMLHKYSTIKKIEVELKQLEEPINLPTRPCKYNIIHFYFIKTLYKLLIYVYIIYNICNIFFYI